MKKFVAVLACVVAANCAMAQALKLPAMISDNMVIQADKPVKVWGWAKPGAQIDVSLGNLGDPTRLRGSATANVTTANAKGQWALTLPLMKFATDATLKMSVKSGDEILTVKNIIVGEVWLCSGQSNMQWSLQQAGGKAEADDEIRFFKTKMHAPQTPQDDCEGEWVVCTPETAAGFSAVGYYFGRDVRKALGRPVGLIQSALGATAIECWTPLAALKADASTAMLATMFENMPKDPNGWDPHLPSGLFNGMIAPFSRVPLRGVIWYQGETNAGRAFQYRTLFRAMIASWRKALGEDVAFYFVQLANHLAPPKEPGNASWAELREAQAMALTLPHTGMAVAIDIGEANNIHPGKKDVVGNRLARQALAKTYGKNIDADGPVYTGMKIEGNKIRVSFDKKPVARGGALKHFAIAGADKKFVWADAAIEGNSVVVSAVAVSQPVAVRYAWANNPEGCNLYNEAGLPASSFRTDDWAGATDRAHLEMKIPEKPAARVSPAVSSGTDMFGNAVNVRVGQTVERPWGEVKTDGYVYAVRQLFANGETRVWLPYGNTKGIYFAADNVKFTDPKPGSVPMVLSDNAKRAASFTWKFAFDKPIASFRMQGGYGEFNLNGAVAGAEYSTDGATWKTFFEIANGGNHNPFIKPDAAKVSGLNTRELYIRVYTRNKTDAKNANVEAAWFKCWTGGDPSWGDASRTFYDRQWQLWVK